MTAILGLNAFHPDSSACLVIDGVLMGAVAEERLGKRSKHTSSFPKNAIRWLLDEANISISDVSHVAVAHAPKANLAAKVKHVLNNPVAGVTAVSKFIERYTTQTSLVSKFSSLLDVDPNKLKFQLHNVEHHLAHIASSYYASQFEKSAGFSYDGSGDFASMMAAECQGSKINILARSTLPHSLGHYYSALCQFIGFDLFGEEYKVMGLAPYGEDTFASEMRQILQVDNADWFKINPKYFTIERGLSDAVLDDQSHMRLGRLFSDEMIRLFGYPRDRVDTITQREKNIARSTQAHFERAALNCFNSLQRTVDISNLSLSGGCALNGVMNARLYRDFQIDKMYIQPASSDDGTAIGAAFHCWHNKLNKDERFVMEHAFWGPEYTESRIREAIETAGIIYEKIDSEEKTIEIAAKEIAKGSVLGWYQGRSEWGPRALGNRSILANPCIKNMKEIINVKIKKRESFRPFAPSVLREDVTKYFEQNIESRFMMHVVKFKAEWRNFFPAVVHADGTGRLQTVDEQSNRKYYCLIKKVREFTGHGIVLNTSFNENEPIVDTPDQAIACFTRTDMDVLILGNYVLRKANV